MASNSAALLNLKAIKNVKFLRMIGATLLYCWTLITVEIDKWRPFVYSACNNLLDLKNSIFSDKSSNTIRILNNLVAFLSFRYCFTFLCFFFSIAAFKSFGV